ncbi:MAG: hypothetical protein AAGF01_14320 [Cyanobacteria bacterium P01_G01_bin.38]
MDNFEELPLSSAKDLLYSAEDIDLAKFNAITGFSKPVESSHEIFDKTVILHDGTEMRVKTIETPGFIGVSDHEFVLDPQGNSVSGYEDIVKLLNRYGLLICTYQGNAMRYGIPLDFQISGPDWNQELFTQAFIKNEGLHAAALVPTTKPPASPTEEDKDRVVHSFAAFDKARNDTGTRYRSGMLSYSNNLISMAQCLVFDEAVAPAQAKEYINSIICWMALLQPCVEFTNNDFDGGGDPVRVSDRLKLKEFLKQGALASLGSIDAIDFLNRPENKSYCAEFIYICLNTPLYPFNKQGLSQLFDRDEQKAQEILRLRDRQNSKRPNFLNKLSRNLEFVNYHIAMPEVSDDLPPLDVLMSRAGKFVDADSIPFPPLKLAHILRLAFKTLFPRQPGVDAMTLIKTQTKLLTALEPILREQLGLKDTSDDDSKVIAVRQLLTTIKEQFKYKFDRPETFDSKMNEIMSKADDMLKGSEGVEHFLPPRIYVDIGQARAQDMLPQGWGFTLKTVGTLIRRECIKTPAP